MTFNLAKSSQVIPLLQSKPEEKPKGPVPGSGPGGAQKPWGKKRIRDRGINWQEHYGERSESLKKKFDKMLGPMAYIRWEGHDYTTDGDYFIIVGPSITQDEKKRFFAGIKRLPDDPKKTIYSPSGEYFSSSHSALSHASQKWGVKFPQGAPNYPESILQDKDIPRHVK